MSVDATTLHGKNLTALQLWHYTVNDGAGRGWDGWFRGTPAADTALFDLYPDVSEFGDDELEDTGLTYPDGRPAKLFSSFNPKTAARYFRWMRQAGIDGASLGRFVAGTTDPTTRARLDTILDHVQRGAEASGRVFWIWYDVTGQDLSSLGAVLMADWDHLTDARVPTSPSYLYHRGFPLVGVWGAGETSMPGDQADWQAIVDYFRGRATLLLGGPRAWHDDPIIAQAAVVSPWAVAAFGDDGSGAGVDAYRRDVLEPDLALCRARGQEYIPILWPGFSWKNLQGGGTLNAQPRYGGRFLWRQVFNAVDCGCDVLLFTMFDEVNEGTAILKAAETQAAVPAPPATFLSLDADGERVSSDFYSRLAGAAGQMLRGEIPLTDLIPIPKEPSMSVTFVGARVTDQTGKKIGNALVQWWDQAGKSDARTTDGEGYVNFGAVSPGTFTWACWGGSGYGMTNGYLTSDTQELSIVVPFA